MAKAAEGGVSGKVEPAGDDKLTRVKGATSNVAAQI